MRPLFTTGRIAVFVQKVRETNMNGTTDRRTARTRRALQDALITLILRKGYEAVTVQDIIDEADIGRSTFYAHYTGKEDLLRGRFDELRVDLDAAQRTAAAGCNGHSEEPLAFSRAMFEHACRYKHVYRALAGSRGGLVAVNEIRRVLSESVKDGLPAEPGDGVVARELAIRFVVGTFLTVLTWLLERKPKLTAAEADRMFRHLVLHGVGVRAAIPRRG
jgi:AcrR family transcriptional regulator